MKLSKIIRKSIVQQIIWSLIFFSTFTISIICIFLLRLRIHTRLSLGMCAFLSMIALYYFLERIINFKDLIKYYGDDALSIKELMKKCDANYSSPNNVPCDHIYINNEYIILIDNHISIIPITKLKKLKFIQKKEVINEITFSTSKWQNTMLMTAWRGLPNTKYCFYEIILETNNAIVKGRLIRSVGNEVINLLKKMQLNLEIIHHPDFTDTEEIKMGKKTFAKDVIPGLVYLIIIGLMALFVYLFSGV